MNLREDGESGFSSPVGTTALLRFALGKCCSTPSLFFGPLSDCRPFTEP